MVRITETGSIRKGYSLKEGQYFIKNNKKYIKKKKKTAR